MFSVVPRKTAITRIKQGLKQQNAVWASAPSGYGKSTVARQYIAQLPAVAQSAYVSLAEVTDASAVVSSLITQIEGLQTQDLQYLDDPSLQLTQAFIQRLQTNLDIS